MIRRLPQLEAVVRRWTDSIRGRKVENLPHYFSRSEALAYLGTSDRKFWRGQLVRNKTADHMSEVPAFSEHDVEIEAWENGETGWARYLGRFHFHASHQSGVHRVTFVFVLEKGAWKIVQHHIGAADSNLENMGIAHQAFLRLIDAAEATDHEIGIGNVAIIMFNDIAGSTALAATMGDHAWPQLIEAHIAQISRIVTENGGQMVKTLGDGTLSTFTKPTRAFAAGKEIQRANNRQMNDTPLRLHIGLHSGEVLRWRSDFFGEVVNKAARIAALAAPDEIPVSDTTRDREVSDTVLVFSDHKKTTLRGLNGDHVLYRRELRA